LAAAGMLAPVIVTRVPPTEGQLAVPLPLLEGQPVTDQMAMKAEQSLQDAWPVSPRVHVPAGHWEQATAPVEAAK